MNKDYVAPAHEEVLVKCLKKGFDGKVYLYDPMRVPLAEIMRWLREVHNISVEISSRGDMLEDDTKWDADIKCKHRLYFRHCTESSYEKVAEAAIKYCVDNLI